MGVPVKCVGKKTNCKSVALCVMHKDGKVGEGDEEKSDMA
jgi:hypothetical protein